MTRFNRIWWSNTTSFAKFKFYKSLVISILLYGSETWTLPADSDKRIQAFKTKCLRKLLCISTWSIRPTTGCRTSSIALWAHRNLFWQLSKRWKLAWFEQITSHNSLSKSILKGILEGGRCRGQQRKCWMNNIKEWTSLAMLELHTVASYRKEWKQISAKLSIMSPQWYDT